MPPDLEIQRVANLLRRPPSQVKERFRRFAAIHEGATEGLPTPRDRALYHRYVDDRATCAADAEWILDGRRWRPAWLYK